MLKLNWGKCQGGVWCGLMRVDLGGDAFAAGGVYVIWHGRSDPRRCTSARATRSGTDGALHHRA